MRPVDADAYADKMREKQKECNELIHEAGYNLTNESNRSYWEGAFAAFVESKLTLDDMPTVDAVPAKHGKWEKKTVDSNQENVVIAEWQSARCSECGRYLTTPYLYYFTKYNFCPECGAKMDSN